RLEEARRRDPTLAGLTDSLAAAYFQRGRYRDAESLFRESAARDPRSTPARYHVGLALFRQGRWRAARKMFDRVLELDPAHAGARNFREECLRREKSPVPRPAKVLLKNP
ncbi:MAG TPA: tetratricopeptide repeat protein, partial [Elusimicrobiota bacterium]|nr:tetratricopeptide repeat protein [Elusimicrobiota bacterium]